MKSFKLGLNGVNFHCTRKGEGPHGILFIPGGLAQGTALNSFAPQFEYFGRKNSGYTAVTFDPRGYGFSRPPERCFTLDPEHHLATDAHDGFALMGALSFSEFSIVGWCGGGISAIHLSTLFPGVVKKMVLIGSKAFVTKEELVTYEKIRNIDGWNPELRDMLLEIYGSSLQNIWSDLVDSLTALVEKKGGDLCKSELPEIQCPTLIVHGGEDGLCPMSHAEYLRDHIKCSRLEVMPEGKHSLHLKYSEEFNKMTDAFLNSQHGRK